MLSWGRVGVLEHPIAILMYGANCAILDCTEVAESTSLIKSSCALQWKDH